MPKKLFGWLDFGSNIFGSVANVISTALTNKINQRIEAARNSMQIAENEKAYQRSKPTNQVAQMQEAGMSKAGALNAINGGATYTPASMSSTPNQAPQVDLSQAFDGLIQIGENAKQRKLQEESLDKQLKAAELAQKAQFEENAKQREHEILLKDIDTANQTQHDYIEYQKHDERLSWEKEMYDRLPEYDKKRYDKAFELLSKQVDIEDWNLNDLKYRVLEYQSKPYQTTRDTQNLLFDIAAQFDIVVKEKELKEFRDSYMYFDLDSKEWKYKPIGNNNFARWMYNTSPMFWDFISRVLPANKLADLIARGLKQ